MGCGASRSNAVEIFTDPMYVDINRQWDMAWKTVETLKVGGMEKKLIVKRRGWKTVRIFVSSTFRDFHQERECLVKQVFPDLRAWCEARRLYLVDVDLRWGVPKDFTSEGTLRACLGEIDRCYAENVMPFFVNMTSERVGWVPADQEVPEAVRSTYKWIEGLSVTEMEIMHGAYRNDNPNALFMLRDSSFIDDVPEEHRKDFVDSDKVAPYKLKILKKMIQDRFPASRVVRYDVTVGAYNPTKNVVELEGLDGTFATTVFEFFQKRIAMQYPLVEETDSDPFTHTRDALEAFLKSRSETVIGRDDVLQKIDSYVCGSLCSDVPFLLVAGAGTGKSSVLAKAADVACTKALYGTIPNGGRRGWRVFYHFVGAVPGSTELLGLLCRLLYEMKALPETSLPSSVETAAQLTCGVLNNPNSQPTIIIIDALNQLDEDMPSLLMNWVPRKLAPNIRCVFTMIDGTPQHKALIQREPQPFTLQLTPLTDDNRQQIVNELLGRYNKKLDSEQMSSLLAKQSSENPLWLSIACEELRVFGQFRELSDKINHLADGLLELEGQILVRFEEENGGRLLIATLCLLEVSARGLLEVELLAVLGDEDHLMPTSDVGDSEKDDEESVGKKDRGSEKGGKSDCGPLPAYKWTEVFRALRPFLRPFGDSGEGRLDFYHRSLSKAVRRRYFHVAAESSDSQMKCWWHKKLADHFQFCSNLQRKVEEYPYHLIAISDRQRLEDFLTEWPTFDELFDDEYSYKLLMFWRQGSTFDRCEECYLTVINNLTNSSVNRTDLCSRLLKVANVLRQAGRYQKSLELAERAKDIEETELGGRPDRMADIYQMCANAMDEEMKLVEYMYRSQIPQLLKIIDMYNRCIELRRTLIGRQHQYKLAHALNRLSFYYSGIGHRGGTEDLSCDVSREKAIEVVEEAIKIFQELNDEGKVADCMTTKGVAYGTACSEQFKTYTEAEEILLRVTGLLHPSIDRLYLNFGIAYEETGDYYKAFDYFHRWFEVCRDLYGLQHSKTKRPISTLREPMYRRIAGERSVEIPEFINNEDA